MRAAQPEVEPASCLEYVSTCFSLELMVERYERAYQEALTCNLPRRWTVQNVMAPTPKDDEHRIVASSARAAEPTHDLKHADMFAVFGRDGDIRAVGAHGLYQNGTRYLSQLELRLNGLRPLLLSSTTRNDNHAFGADLTNPDFLGGDTLVLEHDLIHIFRWRFLWNGCCHERLRLMNYGLESVSLGVSYEFAADFRDIFEVRGTLRERSGTMLEPRILPQAVEPSYRGLDRVSRTTRLSWATSPSRLSAEGASFDVLLRPQQAVTIELAIECHEGTRPSSGQSSEDRAVMDQSDDCRRLLRQLVATQATAVVGEQDAEPGKILHDGDLDGDGFVEYARRSQHGLVQQGWKDSNDSVFHADGTLATAPIALCEVHNPMSYHNGSVWPHDNALIAAGCARYGFTDVVTRILSGLVDASVAFDLHRLPELFCGFHRRENEPPTAYPVACAPQTWAAASVFMLLQASLGLSIDARARRVSIAHPRMPDVLDRLVVRNLEITRGSSLDLRFDRHGHDVAVRVLRKDADISVAMLK